MAESAGGRVDDLSLYPISPACVHYVYMLNSLRRQMAVVTRPSFQ